MDEAGSSNEQQQQQQQPPVVRDEKTTDDKSEDETRADKAEPSVDKVSGVYQCLIYFTVACYCSHLHISDTIVIFGDIRFRNWDSDT